MAKLSTADHAAVNQKDENEKLQEAVDVLTERIHELEQQLVEANLWRQVRLLHSCVQVTASLVCVQALTLGLMHSQDDERASDDLLSQARMVVERKEEVIKVLEEEKEQQTTQLLELSDTVQQLVAQLSARKQEIVSLKGVIESKEAEVGLIVGATT